LLLVCGCGRINFDPVGDGAPLGPPCTAMFGAPAPATILNTPARDWAPAEAADGLTLYFSSNRSGNEELYRSVRASLGAPWEPPQLITELAMPGDEEGNPAPAADELELYWGESQVWRAGRSSRALPFGAPSTVIAEVAGAFSSPQAPHVAPDQRTLYFTAQTATAASEVFVVGRASPQVPFDDATAARIPALGTSADEGWPSLTADERIIFYTSNAAGNLDLMTASRSDKLASFANVRTLTELVSPSADEDAGISADGRTLWFASTRPGGMGDYDIYVATRDCP